MTGDAKLKKDIIGQQETTRAHACLYTALRRQAKQERRQEYIRKLAEKEQKSIIMTKSMPRMKKKNKGKGKRLVKGQKELDKNRNGRLDRQDFQMMRRQKGKGKKKGKKK